MPTTTWDEIAIPPSDMSVQPAPSVPLARLKLSETEPAAAEAGFGVAKMGMLSAPSTSAPSTSALTKKPGIECDL